MESKIPILSPSASSAPPADILPAARDAAAMLGKARRLTITINDPQRQTDTGRVLLALAGLIDLASARIIVAAGSHSFSAEEKRQFADALFLLTNHRRGASGTLAAASSEKGLPVANLSWHDCRSGDLVPIGEPAAWRGHPWLMDSDAILTIGSVEPHYFAGLTGAHKTATIGCAAHADIEANHAWAMDPACRPCRMDGNPIFDRVRGLLEALERQRPVAAINLIQAGGRILFAAGGKAIDTLRSAAPLAAEIFCRRIPRPADAIIAEVDGPLGVSFYQADKGIKNNEWAVRDGGCLILQSPCPRGIGQNHFMELLRHTRGGTDKLGTVTYFPTASPGKERPSEIGDCPYLTGAYNRAVEIVRSRGYKLGDHKAVRLRYLTDPSCRAVRLFIVSDGISAEEAAVLGATKSPTAAHALDLCGLRPGHDAIYRVQDAGNVCVLTEGNP